MQHRRRIADPDRTAVRKVARKIGFRVALLSAVMVIAGVLLLLSYLWVDDQQRRPHGPPGSFESQHRGRGLDVKLDVEDFVQIAPLVGIAVIVLAGGGAMLFARQAVKPLEDSMRRQRNFIGDASHELRTPLAVLDARVQQAQIMAGSEGSLAAVLTELRADSKAMAGIVNDLLAAVSDADTEFAPTPLSRILQEVSSEMNLIAAQQEVMLTVTGQAAQDPQTLIYVPEIALRRSILALIDNALGHTEAGRSVTVEATTTGRFAVLRVIDEGSGITGIAPDQVFERFARGAQASSAQTPSSQARQSHGIGLALVHDVATRYGGAVSVERTGASGTVMRLQLPMVKKK